ncbi:MAG: hypothetical protein ACP5JU_03265 [Minisyncoccia bacterium]
MKSEVLTKKTSLDHFKGPPQLYTIFKKIVEESNFAIYHPLDNALLDLCKLNCNLKNRGDLKN